MVKVHKKTIVLERKVLARDFKITGIDGSLEFQIAVVQKGDGAAVRFYQHVQRVANVKFFHAMNYHCVFLEIDGGIGNRIHQGMDFHIVVIGFSFCRFQKVNGFIFHMDFACAGIVVDHSLLGKEIGSHSHLTDRPVFIGQFINGEIFGIGLNCMVDYECQRIKFKYKVAKLAKIFRIIKILGLDNHR